MPRVALVHDWLNRPIGGGERVLLELARLYPEAPVHTLLFDPGRYAGRLDPARVRTSWLQRLPASVRDRPRYLLPLIPSAVESWDLSGFDVVLSSSVAFVKNVITVPPTLHVCYCHSPMRFAWDYWPRYVDEMEAGPVKRFVVTSLVAHTRRWDLGRGRRGRRLGGQLGDDRRPSAPATTGWGRSGSSRHRSTSTGCAGSPRHPGAITG